MELVHMDVIHIGLSKECIYIAKQKLKACEEFNNRMTELEKNEKLLEMSQLTERWNGCFYRLLQSSVERGQVAGVFDHSLVMKIHKHAMVSDQISRAQLHLNKCKDLLAAFSVQHDGDYLDTILTGGLAQW